MTARSAAHVGGNLKVFKVPDALSAFYETNVTRAWHRGSARIELLRDVFVWAYERSCARYSVVRQNLGGPDAFRLRYRSAIANVVAEVVRNRLDKKSAGALIKQRAAELVAPGDTARFIEVVETETTNLHEGNIARYRIRLSEFEAWRNC